MCEHTQAEAHLSSVKPRCAGNDPHGMTLHTPAAVLASVVMTEPAAAAKDLLLDTTEIA